MAKRITSLGLYHSGSQVRSLGQEDPLEKEMTTHSSILTWEIPWTEEPGRLFGPWGHERVGQGSSTRKPPLWADLAHFVLNHQHSLLSPQTATPLVPASSDDAGAGTFHLSADFQELLMIFTRRVIFSPNLWFIGPICTHPLPMAAREILPN